MAWHFKREGDTQPPILRYGFWGITHFNMGTDLWWSHDLRFLNAMIPHHEGALVMAKDVQAKSARPEMQILAEAILTSQQAEIDEMQQWRKDWYGQ